MKKITLLFCCVSLIVFTNAQAPRYALFEEFTQASCPPCAAQNPGFEANILEKNPATVRQISYHTSWPGEDTMYNHNPAQSDQRVSYYNVTGVPDVLLMGNVKEGGPGLMTQADVDGITSQTSSIKLRVTDVDNGADHDVTVVVESWGTPPAGSNFKLRTAVINRDVYYLNPHAGSNGETYFPNVFLQMLPSTSGDPITMASQGGAATFTYTYTENALWNLDELAVVAFVQNESTKEIINCGASFDPDASIADPAVLTHAGILNQVSSFDISASNYGLGTENFEFTLTNEAPSDWSGGFVVNGNTYSSVATISLDANTSTTATINVTPGATAAIGTYTLTIKNLDNLNQDPLTKTVYVFHGITDLVVNVAGSQGDGTGVSPDSWQANYVNGLLNAGSTTSGVIDGIIAERASVENSLVDVQDIYYNVGWAFPAFTDSWVTQLKALMNSGVNLFIAGQDIGWDVWTLPTDNPPGHGTPVSQDFYTNYLFSDWLDDGGTANSKLTANANDAIFGAFPDMTLVHYYSTYFYPDQISPAGMGMPIFYYNDNTAKVGGVRGDNGTFKMVYLGVGLEMLSTTNSDNVMKSVYNWFHGITGVDEVDLAFQSPGFAYPNPCDEMTNISIAGLKEPAIFTLTNSIGQVVMTKEVGGGSSTLQISTSELPQGIYHFYLAQGGKNTAHSIHVIH